MATAHHNGRSANRNATEERPLSCPKEHENSSRSVRQGTADRLFFYIFGFSVLLFSVWNVKKHLRGGADSIYWLLVIFVARAILSALIVSFHHVITSSPGVGNLQGTEAELFAKNNGLFESSRSLGQSTAERRSFEATHDIIDGTYSALRIGKCRTTMGTGSQMPINTCSLTQAF